MEGQFEDGVELALILEKGEVVADLSDVAAPVLLAAPPAKVVSLGAKLRLSFSGALLIVAVDRGTARVAIGGQSVDLGAGDSVRSDDARFAPARRAVKPDGQALDCGTIVAIEPRAHCYETKAKGNDLSAQTSLYALGLLTKEELHDGSLALHRWRDYQRRFPAGVLAPDVSLQVLTELIAEARFIEAEREAADYLSRFANNGRAAEVALIRANLLREHLGAIARALDAYRAAWSMAEKNEIRDEASFHVAICQLALGRTEEAMQSLRLYRAQFPAGAHRTEVDRLLDR